MNVIHKYQLIEAVWIDLELPAGSVILTVAVQRGTPFIWVLQDTSRTKVRTTITFYGTGTPMPENPGNYVGTFMLEEGALVLHVFEKTSPVLD